MPQSKAGPNYPDLLGYVTDGQRMIVDIVEMAMTIPQKTVRAGTPFEVVLFLQNTADVSVVVNVTMHLPKTDKNKEPKRFRAKKSNMTSLMRPAEVGYLRLPILAHPKTAVGEYQLMLEVDITPSSKPQIVRRTGEDEEVSLDYYFYLPEQTINRLSQLKQFTFSTAKRGWLSKVIFTSFKMASPAKINNQMPDTNWVSLWTLGDHTDARPLLERHQRTLQKDILPQINTPRLRKPLKHAIRKRFELAGYAIKPIEVHYIEKLLYVILNLASDANAPYDYPGEDYYRVAATLKGDLPDDGSPVLTPNWCRNLLHKIDVSPKVIEHPAQTLLGMLFDELLRDGIALGFELIHDTLDESLGDRHEIEKYAEHLIRIFWDSEAKLTFIDAYLPLIIGGILIAERALERHERPLDGLHNILKTLHEHGAECRPEDEYVYNLAEKIIHIELKKYGYRMS